MVTVDQSCSSAAARCRTGITAARTRGTIRVRDAGPGRFHVGADFGVQVDALRVDLQEPAGPVQKAQFPSLVLLLGLLAPEGHLRGHDPLALGYQRALGAHTVPPPAISLVALERRHHPVVPTAGALRGARVPVGRPDEE